MVIALPEELVTALSEQARARGVETEQLVAEILGRHVNLIQRMNPRDDWERGLLAIPRDCGVSLSDQDVSSERIYE